MAITRDMWIVLRARDEASRIIRSFGTNVAGAAGTAAANMTNFERNMQQLALRMQQFAMTSMLAGTALAGVGAAGLGFIKSASDVAVAYEKQVRATKTQVDDVAISLNDLAGVGRRVAREVEIPFEQMQDTLFFIFSSMNVTLAESEQLLKGFAKEAVAGQTSIENAARSNIAIMNALGLTTKDLGRIQDVQFQVVRKGVITYEELANVIGRALPAAARSGQSIETLGAMMAFLTRNGLSAAMASASAARALESFANPITVNRLEQIGIKVRGAKGEFLPLLDVMTQMNKKLKDMTQPDRAAFFQDLFKGAGGTIQARRFWDTAFKNFDDFTEMMGFMTNSAGVFENSYATMADSVANKSVLLENKWMLIKEALGKAVMPHLLKLMTLLGQVLDWFDRLPEPTKNMIAQFILWGSIISILVGSLIVLIGIIAFFVSGIIAGGTALVGVLAAIVAITGGFIAFGLAIHEAWQKSEEFRNVVMEVSKVLQDLWHTGVDAAKNIAQSFEEKVMPALSKLWEIINTRVFPAVRSFVKIWSEEVIPKIKEAVNVIKDIFGSTFKLVADTINNVVIPAIKKLADWWEQNSDSIRPFLKFAGELVKWMLIIAAVFVAAPIVAFFTAIAALILGVYNLVISLKTLWGWITTAFHATVDFFSGLRASIIEFVTGMVQSVIQFLSPLINYFKEVFGLIIDIIKFFTVLTVEVIKDWIKPFVDKVVEGVQRLAKLFFDVWNNIFNTIKDFLSKIFDHVSKANSPIFDEIKRVWNNIADFFAKILKDIINFFKDSGKWLFDAGKGIIEGLINGITDKIKDLRKKLQEITDLIPKIKGPKAVDLKLLVPVGKNIMQGFMNGIESQIPAIKSQLQGLTMQIGQITQPSFNMPALALSGAGVTKNITQNITVNTQEISPRVHAEELGFELGDRL